MKKFLVLILVLSMMLGLVACKSVCEKNGHTDADTNGICDECQSTVVDYEKPSLVGAILKNNIEKQLSEIRSFKFEFSRETKVLNSEWRTRYVEGKGEVEVEILSEETDTQNFEVWATKNGDSFDLKIVNNKRTAYSNTSSLGDFDDYADKNNTLSYVIDGYLYTEIEDGTFNKQKLPQNQLDEIFKKLASADILSKEKKDELLNALGAEIATVLNIRDNAGSVNVDLKDSANELISYITALDFETDTVGEVLDDALAVISKDLTTEILLTERKNKISEKYNLSE